MRADDNSGPLIKRPELTSIEGLNYKLWISQLIIILSYMWEFYWFEFQDPSPSGLLANSRDTQILH